MKPLRPPVVVGEWNGLRILTPRRRDMRGGSMAEEAIVVPWPGAESWRVLRIGVLLKAKLGVGQRTGKIWASFNFGGSASLPGPATHQ